MTAEQYQTLVDQFDQRKAEQPLESADADVRQEWELLGLAADAIRLHAITEEVRKGRLRFEREQRELELAQAERELERAGAEDAPPIGKMADMIEAGRRSASPVKELPVVRRRISPMLQIAAAFIVIVVSAGVIKVANTHPEAVFDRNYSDYQLSVTRGADVSDALEEAYRTKNWAAVYRDFDALHAKTQKDYFLTAMARMQQKDYYEAISLLKTLMQYNSTGDAYFEDEAEYYLALNYLATGQAAPAVALFDKIKADPRHVYHSRVMQMNGLDLGILRMK